jgi:hypothetical protein
MKSIAWRHQRSSRTRGLTLVARARQGKLQLPMGFAHVTFPACARDKCSAQLVAARGREVFAGLLFCGAEKCSFGILGARVTMQIKPAAQVPFSPYSDAKGLGSRDTHARWGSRNSPVSQDRSVKPVE